MKKFFFSSLLLIFAFSIHASKILQEYITQKASQFSLTQIPHSDFFDNEDENLK